MGQWSVPLNDGVYVIQFEHGTNSGKRVLRVNGQVKKKRSPKLRSTHRTEFPGNHTKGLDVQVGGRRNVHDRKGQGEVRAESQSRAAVHLRVRSVRKRETVRKVHRRAAPFVTVLDGAVG